MKSIKINICMPVKDTINIYTVQCLVDLIRANKEHDVEVLMDQTFGIDASRNKLVERSLKADYILFVDSDIVFRPNALRKLLECKKDIVGGIYFGKGFPHWPIAFYKEGEGYQPFRGELTGLMEFDAVGCGFLLVKTEVYRKIREPWFVFKPVKGEDLYFSEKARKAGYKIYLNCDVQPGHYASKVVNISDWKRANRVSRLEKDGGVKSLQMFKERRD